MKKIGPDICTNYMMSTTLHVPAQNISSAKMQYLLLF